MKSILVFILIFTFSIAFGADSRAPYNFKSKIKLKQSAIKKNVPKYKKKKKKKSKYAKKSKRTYKKSKKRSKKRRYSKRSTKKKTRIIAKTVKKKKSKAKINSKTKLPKKAKYRKYTENLYFNYGATFLGPSLSSDYQGGSTYNRFKTGQDIYGLDMDPTGSYQFYHSLTLGYNLAKDYKVSFGYTFQDDINDKVKYEENNPDGSTYTATRARGVSDNNKRINLFVSNIVNNKYFYINSSYFYEMASTNASKFEDRLYGLGIEPSLNFYMSNPALSTGITTSVQRNYFRKNYNDVCYEGMKKVTCNYPYNYQTLLVNLGAYANYIINDYMTFKSSVKFDWDMRGDDVNDLEKFNDNMDNVGRVGMDFLVDYGMKAGTFLEFGIEDPDLKKTALGLTLDITLY